MIADPDPTIPGLTLQAVCVADFNGTAHSRCGSNYFFHKRTLMLG
jgi:hypothetical protein